MSEEKLPEDVYRELLKIGWKAMKFLNDLMDGDDQDIKAYAVEAFVNLTPVVAALAEALGEKGQERRSPLSRRLRNR